MKFPRKMVIGISKSLGFGALFAFAAGLTFAAVSFTAKTNWTEGDRLTQTDMNRIEQGILDLSQKSGRISGEVVAFNLSTCPSGWSAADGRNGRPNLQNNFVRGLGAGRSLRSFQAEQSNSLDKVVSLSGYPSPGTSTAENTIPDDGSWTINIQATGQGSWDYDGLKFKKKGVETRPDNVALLYCVKN